MERAESLPESEECFRGAFQAAAIGFALVDLDCRLRAVNEPLCRMLGYSKGELLGRTYQELTHPDDHAVDEALRVRVLAGEETTNHAEKRYLHKSGQVVWGLLAVSLVRDDIGQPSYFVAQVTDITRIKVAEQERARYAAELERWNAELREYAAVASHDLKAPLRIVSSYAQLVMDRYHDTLDDDGRRWLAYIVAGVERMHSRVDGMLALARVRTDGNGFGETDVGELVAAAWRELQESRGSIDAILIVEALPTVVADRAQLEALLRNLLENALKYRRADLSLEIRISAERTAGGDREPVWQFSVADNGIGLDMAHAARIFEIFHRLHQEDEYEGTGIGLAICRRIVERHGGRIWVESTPNQGATFRFTLESHAPT
jgi:PAS domain S-box-containing protein